MDIELSNLCPRRKNCPARLKHPNGQYTAGQMSGHCSASARGLGASKSPLEQCRIRLPPSCHLCKYRSRFVSRCVRGHWIFRWKFKNHIIFVFGFLHQCLRTYYLYPADVMTPSNVGCGKHSCETEYNNERTNK